MQAIDLSGQWQIHHDPLSQGLSDRWWEKPPSEGWREITVPSAWQSVLGVDAYGIAWYRHDLPPETLAWARAGRRARLRFESVATDCRIWVAGIECGRHLGDYMPFEIDITDALSRGNSSTQLFVRVDQYQAPRPPKGVVVENGHVAKGFHDVLSIQHAGIWGGVSVRQTGKVTIPPNSVFVDADPNTGKLSIRAELKGDGSVLDAVAIVRDPAGRGIWRGPLTLERDDLLAECRLEGPLSLWSPDTPSLYALSIELGAGDQIERHQQRFGFRTAATGGPGNSQILLNNNPLQIRGILHWGHEPRHFAPAPPPEQVREEFRKLRELGFNCVCLCMFYPPDYYYDIADETGMLLWQEHPIWKSRMTPDLLPEYRRCYEAFFRRDRRHPSVVIVSATCEHEAFDPDLGRWWWQRSGELLPRTLRQVQTGFLEQTPPDQTDLYDDHVYDNCGRWIPFLSDMQSRISELPPRPFVMGETIISNAWPDISAIRERVGDARPWWLTRGLDECAAFEREMIRRHAPAPLTRFKEQGDRFGKAFRKFQAEALRMFPRNAGFVTNSIRDVPICRIGFMDDLDRWRFHPDETRPWLSDAILLLETPEHRRGFRAGERIQCRIGTSNFSPAAIDGSATIRCGNVGQDIRLAAKPGEIAWAPMALTVPEAVEGPIAFEVSATLPGLPANRWTLVAIPRGAPIVGVVRLDGMTFTPAEREPEFEERAYSSGWGLPCRTWKPRLPDLAALLPNARAVPTAGAIPDDIGVLAAHRLTRPVYEFVRRGGRCVLLAHRHAGGMGTKWINLWGQLPLIVENDSPSAAIRVGESDALLALLAYDLTRGSTRAVPTGDWEDGLREHIDPIIRYVWTHDAGMPKCFDAVFSARVEQGLLVVSCLDHSEPAGAWFIDRLLRFAAETPLTPAARELDLSRFIIDAA